MSETVLKTMLVFEYRTSEENFFANNEFQDYEIIFYNEILNEDIINDIVPEIKERTEIISIFINSAINENILKSFKNLKIISTRSTGVNHINLVACKENNIAVINVKSYGAKAVAQYTLGLIIALERRLFFAIEDMRKGKINIKNYAGRNLNNLTLGIVGTGEIGVGVAKTANAMGMNILAYDILPKYWLEQECSLKYVDFETLVKESDIITLHVPYKEENYHIFSDKEFKSMKNNAVLVNTSRGELVDVYALYNALENKQINGCALDVVECEQFYFSKGHFLKNLSECSKNCLSRAHVVQRLMEMPNVIMTPHIAYNTTDAIEEILRITMENIDAYYKGEKSGRVV